MIEVENLTKVYGGGRIVAVDNISFKVDDGEILGFAGLNGAGKTTTIETICGVSIPTSGSIFLDGSDIVKDKVNASKTVGWVSEFPAFEMNEKPLKLLQYYAGFYDHFTSDSKRVATQLLNEVGLGNAVNRKLREYSQGMLKRFSLASAMLSNPKNYLLDEVLNGLDPGGVNFVRRSVLDFKSQGKSILLSTHILGALENLADRIAIIHKGKLIKLLSRDGIRSLGRTVLELKTNKIDENLIKLLGKFGKPVVQGDHIVISEIGNPEATSQEVGAAVTGNGYGLMHLSIVGESLEEYFLQLIEDET